MKIISNRMAKTRKTVISADRVVEKLKSSNTADENAKWYNHFGNSLAVSHKVKAMNGSQMTQQLYS